MDLSKIELEDLTIEEKKTIEGGDDFMHDLGTALGTFFGNWAQAYSQDEALGAFKL